MGQSSSTLSGGEAQRIKLASFLVKGDKEKALFVTDQPQDCISMISRNF
jgi:excinuclease ABC subunit A